MSNNLLIYSPILSFFKHCFASGIPKCDVIAAAAKFYSADTLKDARGLLLTYISAPSAPTRFPDRRGENATNSLSEDIYSMFSEQDNTPDPQYQLPKFVLTASDIIPSIESDLSSNLSRALHTWDRHIQLLIDKTEQISAKVSAAPEIICASLKSDRESSSGGGEVEEWPKLIRCDEIVSMRVEDPPPNLDNPIKRKTALSSLNGASGIKSVKTTNDGKWLISVQKSESEQLRSSLNAAITSDITLQKEQHIGIVKNVTFAVDTSDLSSVNPGICGFQRIGKSKTAKVFFESRNALVYYTKKGLVMGYEHFSVGEYRRLPKMCFKCQALDHVTSNCNKNIRCSKCSENGHSNTKDNPCSRPIKCCHCSSPDHPCFSFQCKVIQKEIDGSSATRNASRKMALPVPLQRVFLEVQKARKLCQSSGCNQPRQLKMPGTLYLYKPKSKRNSEIINSLLGLPRRMKAIG